MILCSDQEDSLDVCMSVFKHRRLESWLEDSDPDDSIGELYWAFKEEIIPTLHKIFQEIEDNGSIKLSSKVNITLILRPDKNTKNTSIHTDQ